MCFVKVNIFLDTFGGESEGGNIPFCLLVKMLKTVDHSLTAFWFLCYVHILVETFDTFTLFHQVKYNFKRLANYCILFVIYILHNVLIFQN